MKRRILSSVTIAAFMGILLTWAPSVAYAGEFESPATVIRDFGCFLSEDDGGGPGGSYTEEMTHSVTNKNIDKIVCHFTGVPNNTGKAIRHSGFLCETFEGFTTDSMSVVSANGDAELICTVKAT